MNGSNKKETIKMKTSIIDISNDKKHKLRYSHCLGLMINELWNLNNLEVKNILDKYSCGVFQQMGILDATLRFPISLKESDLPKILQLNDDDRINPPIGLVDVKPGIKEAFESEWAEFEKEVKKMEKMKKKKKGKRC